MTEYDGQDQAYQDLLEEANRLWDDNDMLKHIITEICDLIHYQAHLKHQDKWLKHCINIGLYTIEEE